MKTLTIVLFLLTLGWVLPQHCQAQINLVPNPSFEDTIYCPWGLAQEEAAQHWISFRNTPDYYNSCSPGMNVPNGIFGFQNSHSGNGIIGLSTYKNPQASGPNYREFIGTTLSSPLLIGTKYYISFFVSLANNSMQTLATSNLGLRFYTAAYDSISFAPIFNFAHINSSTIITDTVQWVRISGSFISDSTYTHFSIGNHFNDSLTDTIHMSSSNGEGYYYIDDVCITSDSIYNEVWTGINQTKLELNSLILYPNPTNGLLYVNSYSNIKRIKVFTSEGKLIFDKHGLNQNWTIELLNLNSGLYVLEAFLIDNTSIKNKFLINH